MRLAKLLFFLVFGVALILLPRFWPEHGGVARITSISEQVFEPLPHYKVQLTQRGQTIESLVFETQVDYKIGEKVLVSYEEVSGKYTVTDYYRTPQLVQLFGLFLLVVFLVSGASAIRSLVGLSSSFVIIFAYILPQIASGSNPLIVVLTASVVILLVSYYITHGVSAKTTIALLGTMAALLVTGILTLSYGAWTRLTGFGSEEAGFLLSSLPASSMYNLVLAGMIVSTLGVLDDVTISQASIVSEIKKANEKLSMVDLYTRAMRVGRDHIASVVNTLVLVYAGSALPLLLLFTHSEATVWELLNYEAVAEEIVRTMVGSIGLVLAVPITTLIAAYWFMNNRSS
jgi:uncharacterized membrane protein